MFEVLSDALSRRIKDFFTRLRVAREGAFESFFDDRELRLRGDEVRVSRRRLMIGGAEFFRPRPPTALRNRPPIGAQLARGGVDRCDVVRGSAGAVRARLESIFGLRLAQLRTVPQFRRAPICALPRLAPACQHLSVDVGRLIGVIAESSQNPTLRP